MKNSNECRYCKSTLTVMPEGCKRCLECHPINNAPPVQKKVDDKYVDVPWTKERILDAIKDDVQGWIENWFAPTSRQIETEDSAETVVIKPKTYREEAKELGIKTFGKTKEAVLVEIAEARSAKADAI